MNEGVEWLILTNGEHWQVWHLGAGLPITMDLVIDVHLLSDAKPADKVEPLFYLTKAAMKRQSILALWQTKRATSPASIARALLSASVLDALRKEIRRQTEHNPTLEDVEQILRSAVVRAECLS